MPRLGSPHYGDTPRDLLEDGTRIVILESQGDELRLRVAVLEDHLNAALEHIATLMRRNG